MRTSRVTVRALAALAVFVALPASNALAHASLDNSVPVSGATLVDSPPQVALDFDETVETALGFIRLFGSDGSRIELPAISRDAADTSVVRVDLPQLADDTYVVTYRVVSFDGHRVDGAITFQVGEGQRADVSTVIADAFSDVEASGAVEALARIVRLVGYVALALVLGSILFVLGIRRAPTSRLLPVLGWSSLALAVASFASLALHGALLAGGGLGGAFDTGNLADVADTRVGHALLARLGSAVLLGVVATVVIRLPERGALLRFPAVLAVVVLPLTHALGGHPGAVSPQAVGVFASWVHVVAIATWLGGLMLLATMTQLRDLPTVKWFSQRAVAMVGLAVVSGATLAFVVVEDMANILDITYGKMLATKLVVVGVLLLVAAVVRRRFLESGVERLRSVLATEAIVGIFIFGITSGLVAETPRVAASNAPFATTLVQGETLVNVTVSPGRVGPVEMHVIITTPGGSLEPVASARIRLSAIERDIPPIALDPAEVGPNHFVATAQIPHAGRWKLDIIVVEDDGRESLYATNFEARP